MKRFYCLLFLLISTGIFHTTTRTDNLPKNFKWRYTMDEQEPSPRTGQFWRDGVFISDKIVVLNSHYLIGLDQYGKKLWINALPAEEAFSEAKIHPVSNTEIIVITSDSLLRIDINTGELLKSYNYDVAHRAVFQMTELMPRHSILLNDFVYVFLGSQLLSFHTNSLERATTMTLISAPKTIPVKVGNQILVGLQNKTALLLDPITKKSSIYLSSLNRRFKTLRQPIIIKNTIYFPTDREIHVFENDEEINRTSKFTNAILDLVSDKIWMRKHNTGTITELDRTTLDDIRTFTYEDPKYADRINTPLIGKDNTVIHIDTLKGHVITLDISKKEITTKSEIFVEDLLDNPPLQFLDQKDNLILLGAFDSLYLATIN
ncbi:MAG: hypothetical protein ACRCTJ_05245 [Brevinema sp.]